MNVIDQCLYRVATEIVLAEYTNEGRAAIQLWLEIDPNAFNWYLYFKYVVQTLEGETTTATEQCEEQLRTILKAVVHCDIAQDPPIEKNHQTVLMLLIVVSVSLMDVKSVMISESSEQASKTHQV